MSERESVDGKTYIILGTAPTWRQAPWDDPNAVICGLNDMYLLKPPRIDRWYDLHPFDRFWFRPHDRGAVLADHVPAGYFVRPVGHLEWLAKQSIPVYIQRADPRVPHALIFPQAEVEARCGPWYDSTPAQMLAHAMVEGYRKIGIFGIHLATEWEYLKQKPNLCYLIGLAVGMGVEVTVPKDSPLMRWTHRYAYEPDPADGITQAQRDGARVARDRDATQKAWAGSKRWWHRQGDPLLRDRARWLAAQAMDAQLAVEWQTARKRAVAAW